MVRNYRSQDFDACVQFNLRFAKSDVLGGVNLLEALTQKLNRPGYCPSEDLFVVAADGAIVGYIDVMPELGIGRVLLDCQVHQAYDVAPIRKALLDCALERAREMGARAVHVNLASTGLDQSELLLDSGFSVVRRYYELRLDLSEINLGITAPLSSAYCHLEAGEEERLTQIQNRCFVGSWAYNPNTIEDIAWQLKIRGDCSDDVILARDGNKLIGYCWTEACGQDSPKGKNKGRIYMLGVDPGYRSRGVGRELLLAGLAHLKSKGREIVDITVDSQNVAAVALYYSLGFRLSEETLWYEKIID